MRTKNRELNAEEYVKEGIKTKEPETQNSVKTPQLLNSQMLPPCDSFNFRNILVC